MHPVFIVLAFVAVIALLAFTLVRRDRRRGATGGDRAETAAHHAKMGQARAGSDAANASNANQGYGA